MAGFIRRYGFFPGQETITLIEGVVIIDLPPPGSVQGVGTGTTALVGEFADMTYAVAVSPSGAVTTATRPVEVFSSQDMLNKVGGFDETLGDFGVSEGNGFVALRNKTFSRLILAVANLASSRGGRATRELPTNLSATNPSPVVPMQAATVAAGREFKTGNNRVRTAGLVTFTGDAAYATGTDGSTVVAAAAATQNFSSAGANFLTSGVKKGDILQLGVIGGAGAIGTNANTYRVNAVVDANNLTVEKQDGSNFAFALSAVQPWRLHIASTADSGGNHNITEDGGFPTPARPLDATIAASTVCTPTVVPTANAATSWDPLSGLHFVATSNASGIVFTAAVQAPNAVAAGAIDALYSTAIDGLQSQDLPARDVNILFSARTSSTIRSKQKSHVLNASAQGVGRTCVLWPELNQTATATVEGDSDPGVGANRDERVDYSWPGAMTFVPEAVNFALKCADGVNTGVDAQHPAGVLDTAGASWLASVLSNLPPERNPGQAAPPVPTVLAPILGIQRGVVGLSMNDYTAMRQRGICGLRIDRTVGPIFQSGVTTSLIAGQKNINRRRIADFIEDSLAQRLVQFAKLPMTTSLKDGATGETIAFLEGLLSRDNPAAQRISDYSVDQKSGNTPTLEAAGIFVLIVKVRTLATADFIVLQAEIGEGVQITQQ